MLKKGHSEAVGGCPFVINDLALLTPVHPMPYTLYMATTMIPKTFKLYATQYMLLRSPKYKERAQAIVRTLLNAYFNMRTLTPAQIEALIDKDFEAAVERNSKKKTIK